jgi:hypothetical protein
MLRNTKDLENHAIIATDGPIGHVKDFYFDDDDWVIRYLMVDAGTWLTGRNVLISPISVRDPAWQDQALQLSITREQVRNSPDIDTHKPVSRQNEEQYLGYFGYTNYWGEGGYWGSGMYPYTMVPGYAGDGLDRLPWAKRNQEDVARLGAERARHRNDDPHLRSCKAVAGYHMHATDGEIGHVAGYLVDDETWAIRYMVVSTSNWWLGHKVLIAPAWITGVYWPDKTVSINLSRESVKASPVYDPDAIWSPEHDRNLYQHYGRASYWSDNGALVTGI